jgi:BirA family transcriptional regulator, biotin operon repressor / biotin---[acetyl-CoA-carboxylase] ligase
LLCLWSVRQPPLELSMARTSHNSFDLARLREQCRPFRVHWFPRLRSTNDHAAKLRREDALFAPAIVLSGHQLAGRGRGSNAWWSGRGSLTVTFVLAANERLSPHQLPLIAGLCVRDATAQISGINDIQLKWPNDLLHHGRKLAGLLCERLDRADLIGLGLNVNVALRHVPAALRSRVTSLSEIAHAALDVTDVLATVARRLHATVAHRDEHSFATVLAQYDRHHALIGQRIRVTTAPDEPQLTGVCTGLDSMGRLLLRDRARTHRVIAGHVDFHKPAVATMRRRSRH